MSFNKIEIFDLIMSLGGNCSVASQLIKRNLRHFSLPFDYTFMGTTRPIEYFAEGLKDHFKNFFLKENLVELAPDEKGPVPGKYEYKDTYSEYRFIHHFHAPKDTPGEYEKAKAVMDKRINRMYEKINEANRILVILSTAFQFDDIYIYKLKETFEELYPKKEFVFYTIMLSADEFSEKTDGNMCFIRSKRPLNMYDVNKTNFEWEFLDMVRLSKTPFDRIKISFKCLNRLFQLDFRWGRYK